MGGSDDVITFKDAKARGLNYYFEGTPCKKGHVSKRYFNGNKRGACYECTRQNAKDRQQRIYADSGWHEKEKERTRKKAVRLRKINGDKINARTRQKYAEDAEYREMVLKRNAEFIKRTEYYKSETRRKWFEENPEKLKKYGANWRKNNPGTAAYLGYIGRRKRRQAMPDCITDDQKKQIQKLYAKVYRLNKKAGKNKPGQCAYHVDHIVPITHDEFSGLHVPWNLQVITAEENLRKSNKWETV